jgi:hypothetical protein
VATHTDHPTHPRIHVSILHFFLVALVGVGVIDVGVGVDEDDGGGGGFWILICILLLLLPVHSALCSWLHMNLHQQLAECALRKHEKGHGISGILPSPAVLQCYKIEMELLRPYSTKMIA